MRAALVIAVKDLRQRLRDRTFLIVGILAPLGLAAIFSLVLPSDDGGLDLRYAIADEDGTPVSAGLRDGALASLEEAEIATVREVADNAAAEAAVDAGEVDAAIVVPAGFGESVTAGDRAELEIIGDTGSGLGTDILRSVAGAYAAELEAIRLAVLTAAQATGTTDPAAFADLAERAGATSAPIALDAADVQVSEIVPATFFAGSMAIFFLFFTAQFGVLSLLTERRVGTLPRLLAAPIRPSDIVLGKAIGSFALGVVAMAVLVVASTLLLGADWGNPLGVALLVLAAVTAAMGITALITTLARTEEQAGGWNSIVAVTLAILGGSFFDLSQGPEILRQASLVTPHAWFLGGLDALASDTATPADLAPSILVLLAMGLVTGAIGLVRARQLVVRR